MFEISKIAPIIDLCIIPLTMLSYYQSLRLTKFFSLNSVYFFFILFILVHISSSFIIILNNYIVFRKFRPSMWLIGFGPTIVAIITLLLITLLPFLKWPFYILKFIPNFDYWIEPFIIGLFSFFMQILLRKTVNNSIMEADQNISNKISET